MIAHARFAAELRSGATLLRDMAASLVRRADEQDHLGRQAEARRQLASVRYAEDRHDFRGVAPNLTNAAAPLFR